MLISGIPSKIGDCEKLMQYELGQSDDLVFHKFDTVKGGALVVFIDGLVNKDLIDRDVMTPLKSAQFDGNPTLAVKTPFKDICDVKQTVESILSGNVAVFYEGFEKALIAELRGWEQRSVEEPTAETVIRGPKEGFTENIRTNTSLIRRKIKTADLMIENLSMGLHTNTKVNLVYIQGIVNRSVLQELKKRLSAIGSNVDAILETGYIEQYIDENAFSPVSGIGITQKPDNVATSILEGRVAVLCDGTPHALIVPELFMSNIQTAEDYYNRSVYASAMRLLRLFGLFITVMLPGLSVAIITFNQEMLPSVFLTSIISASQKTPMPVSAEIILLTIMFELLREAGTRLPKAVGSAITIVGSLIIGEAAVNAGIVSEPSVIIVALTAVSSFMVPNLFEFALIYRLFYWILGTLMGIIGIAAGFFIMMTQLISVKSFGVPILSSFSKQELKDSVVRFPLRRMVFRPVSIVKDNVRKKTRQFSDKRGSV